MSEWIKGVDYPEWGDENYLTTLKGGYLQNNESPKQAYRRVASSAMKHLQKVPFDNLEERIYELFWKGWLIPSTPVMANMGSGSASPISCFSVVSDDTISSIWEKAAEIAIMSKMGGGTAIDVSSIRPVGTPIRKGTGGYSDGVIPFLKVYDATVNAAKQSGLRRGSCAVYLDIEHAEAKDFLKIIKSDSGENFCSHLQTALVISNEYMQSLETNLERKKFFKEVLKMRIEKGMPYLMWKDTANNNKPFKWNTDITIKASNLC